jgi:CheY-like chemotaxis protein/ketosteroid isomerase-like protein
MNAAAATRQCILLAEPEPSIRALFVTLLGLEGYATDQAMTLEEALAKVEGSLYDVVLTDAFRRPRQSPLLGAQQLAQRAYPTPVGLLTGWPVNQEEARRAGLAFVLQKPFELDGLLHHLTAQLTAAWSTEQQQQAQLVRRYLQALGQEDWAALRLLCTPDVVYAPLTPSLFTSERTIRGIEAYLAHAQEVLRHFPAFQIERVVVFHHPIRVVARYVASWQRAGGREREQIAGSATFLFRGERLQRIGVAVNTRLLQHLLA